MANTFTLSRADYGAFRKVAGALLRKRRGLGVKLFLNQIAAWFFIGLAGASFMQLFQRTPELRFSLGFVAILLSLGVLALGLAPLVSARIVRKHLLLDGGTLLAPQTAVVNEEGIALVGFNGGSSSHFKWRAFIGRAEDERNHYLFIEPSYGIIVPKAALSQEEVARVRSSINEL